jgi:hypothetical protein
MDNTPAASITEHFSSLDDPRNSNSDICYSTSLLWLSVRRSVTQILGQMLNSSANQSTSGSSNVILSQ